MECCSWHMLTIYVLHDLLGGFDIFTIVTIFLLTLQALQEVSKTKGVYGNTFNVWLLGSTNDFCQAQLQLQLQLQLELSIALISFGSVHPPTTHPGQQQNSNFSYNINLHFDSNLNYDFYLNLSLAQLSPSLVQILKTYGPKCFFHSELLQSSQVWPCLAQLVSFLVLHII